MSAKNLDSKGRFRSRTIGFRVSPEEGQLINSAVALSGLTKQDYIVKRLLSTIQLITTTLNGLKGDRGRPTKEK